LIGHRGIGVVLSNGNIIPYWGFNQRFLKEWIDISGLPRQATIKLLQLGFETE